jgi:hypothetical protein
MASYRIEVAEEAKREIRRLPGNMRQRVIRVLRALQQEPRPRESQALDSTAEPIDLPPSTELCRIRLAFWLRMPPVLWRRASLAEQNRETFLAEVVVVGENLRDALVSHRVHRDAVDQAVGFVGALLVQFEPSQEREVRLW